MYKHLYYLRYYGVQGKVAKRNLDSILLIILHIIQYAEFSTRSKNKYTFAFAHPLPTFVINNVVYIYHRPRIIP